MTSVFGFAQRLLLSGSLLLSLTAALSAQEAPADLVPQAPHVGVPEDWSTRHVIYTRNGSVEDMMKVRNDPRFLNSFLIHAMGEARGQAHQAAAAAERGAENPEAPLWSAPTRRNHNSKVDWAVSLGPTAGMAFGESPAKYTFDPNAPPSCSDFLVYTISATPKIGTQANLVGLTNLYSGTSPTGLCGTNPTFLFSYAIGTGGSDLSPVLSLDGKKIAWLENRTRAYFHVTSWVAGQGTDATHPVGIPVTNDVILDYTNSAYPGCTANGRTNSNSNMYIDYPTDTAFVAADNGILYHFKGVFLGTPSVDFCVVVNNAAGTGMSGTVYDALTNQVFVSDSKKMYAYTVNSGSFTLASSITYGNNTFSDSPLLDSFNGFIYMFSSKDKNGNTSVAQFPVNLSSVVLVPLGPANTFGTAILLDGTFDNNYFTFGPTNSLATLYTCGTDSTVTSAQDLFTVTFLNTGIINTTPAMSQNKNVNPGNKTGTCSPITEFYDGTKDRMFVGMGNISGTGGANVVQMWDITSRITSSSATPTASASPYLGGTTSFTIDNASSQPQAQSIYFSTITTNGTATCGANLYCAVKLTQSALK